MVMRAAQDTGVQQARHGHIFHILGAAGHLAERVDANRAAAYDVSFRRIGRLLLDGTKPTAHI
jgi:hypothetical protein